MRRGWTRARGRILRGLAPALLLACTARDETGPAAGGGSGPLRISLLDALDSAVLRGDLSGLDGSGLDVAEVVLRDEFDQPPRFPWFDGEWVAAVAADPSLRPQARAPIRVESGITSAAVQREQVGLHAIVAAGEDEGLLIRVRGRASAASGSAGMLIVPGAAQPPGEPDLAGALAAFESGELGTGEFEPLAPSPDRGWRELSRFVGPRAGRRSLSVSLLPGTGELEVDRVEILRLRKSSLLHHSPRLLVDRAGHPLRRVVDVGRALCDALLAPTGASVAWRIAIPLARPRLRFLPGAIGPPSEGGVGLSLRVDGSEAWRADAVPLRLGAQGSLDAVEIDLARFAGRVATVEFLAAEGPDAVAFFGAPELLADAEGAHEPNLLLISLDTLRADHVGCYGDARGLTPELDALAASGLRFDAVVAPSSWTLPSHVSAMTGQHPLLHGAVETWRVMDPSRSRPLAARLRELGVATAAFTGGGNVQPRNGLGAGFDLYSTDDPCGATRLRGADGDEARAAPLEGDHLAPALEWLRAHAGQRFFLFVHTFLVHNYEPSPEFLARFADPARPVNGDRGLLGLAQQGDIAAAERMRQLYAATVAEADATLVRRLLAELRALGLDDGTIVCVISDHGEEHLEHGATGHHRELFAESTRVPWILRGPGVSAGAVRRDAVELTDVAPTLAALLRLPPDPLVFGRDLLASGSGEDEEPEAALLTLGESGSAKHREALLFGPWKLMRWRRGDETEVRLFRIDRDPAEREDLAAQEPARLRELTARLDAMRRDLETRAAALPGRGDLTRELSPAEIERLRDLGYVVR